MSQQSRNRPACSVRLGRDRGPFTLRNLALGVFSLWLLGACSAVRVSYNNADSLLRYMAWDYLDPDEQQSALLQQRIAAYHEWHRARELPAYVELLTAARQRLQRGLRPEDVQWAIGNVRERYHRLTARAAHDAAPVLATLSSGQIEGLDRKIASNDRKFVDQWLSGDARRRERRAVERMVERFENWTGRLGESQREMIERFVRAYPDLPALQREHRLHWQTGALSLIRSERAAARLAPALAALLANPDSNRSAEYRRVMQRWESDLGELIVALEKTLTRAQREHLLARLDEFSEDFRVLSRGATHALAPQGAGS